MAKIALRNYIREIEILIANGRYDQASDHCRYILQSYPKHIETYRVLGKAFLENQRYSDAADILQRVLSCVPEDFVAHVGMSMIRQDEGNLEEAVWHMERAFEQQPANSAIQEELRKLHARKSGTEPPKVRLTRGALARMYYKGELYQQASAELRAALAEDPERLDLMCLLAQSYFKEGKKVEAAETSSQVLQKLPYSLAGNQILAEILAGSERAAESKVYRQRVQMLDPYETFVSSHAPSASDVPAEAIQIEQLDWHPGMTIATETSQPDWAASLGVKVEGLAEQSEEEIPAWLESLPKAGEDADYYAADGPEESEPEEPAGEVEMDSEKQSIPDFMQAAGWEPGSDDELPPPTLFEKDEDELAPAEIPDWLQDLEPDDATAVENTAEFSDESLPEDSEFEEDIFSSTLPGSGALSWLDDTPPGSTDTVAAWLEETQEQDDNAPPAGEPETPELPAWLEGLDHEDAGKTAKPPAEEDELPDWLQELGPATVEEDEPPPSMPDRAEVSPIQKKTGPFALEESEEDLPDWLRELEPGSEEPADTQSGKQAPPEPLGFDKTGIGHEADEAADWLSEFGEPGEEQADMQPAETQEAAPEPESDFDAAFAWLEGLAAKQGAEEALLLSPDERRSEPPEWVRAATEKAQIEQAAEQPENIREMPAADDAPGEEVPGFAAEIEAEDSELPDWLAELDSEETTPPPDSALPPFLENESELTQVDQEMQINEQPPFEAEETDLQAWLAGLDEEEAVAELPEQSLPESPRSEQTHYETTVEEMETLPPAGAAEEHADLYEELPDWLAEMEEGEEGFLGLEEPPVIEGDTQPSQMISPEEPAAEDTGELPDWLAALESETYQPAAMDGVEIEHDLSTVEEIVSPVEDAEASALKTATAEEAEKSQNAEQAEVDIDAAFAWLEGLAARQGAEEALLLSPEERRTEPPDWVRAEAEAAAEAESHAVEEAERPAPEAELAAGELPDWLKVLAPDDAAPATEVAAVPDTAEEETAAEIERELEAELTPEGDITAAFAMDEIPAADEPELAEEKAHEISTEDLDADETGSIAITESEAELSEPKEYPAVEEAEELENAGAEIPEWLRDLAPDEEELAVAEAQKVETEEVPELPEWLAGIDEEPATEPWTPPTAAIREPLDLNQAPLNALERIPGMGYIRAAALVAYREAHGSFQSLDELTQVPGISREDAADLRPFLTLPTETMAVEAEPVQAYETDSGAGELPAVQESAAAEIESAPVLEPEPSPVLHPGDNQIILLEARNALAAGDQAVALEKYQALIGNKKLLVDVVNDLNEALYRFPVSVEIWMALGDAHAARDALQEALDAYTKAEDLLR